MSAVGKIRQKLTAEVEHALRTHRQHLVYLMRSRGLSRPLDLLRSHQQRVDDLAHRTGLGLRASLLRAQERLRLLEAQLTALSPTSVLSRGFAIIERDGAPITRAAMLAAGDAVTIRLADDKRSASITD